ncbi:hypothetical protein BC938DRAFT_479839 [Jimgerdemannia flammicorona]|uniref:F-box domain-containing protein n=1 Tax=Jimgerdemannia flammicorona TaxID=994334 RepID=A0A433QK22_9FUNG|nr:hypothetical protein BC938DRAFT_479839 [Jimgerdemannia flammicorona]
MASNSLIKNMPPNLAQQLPTEILNEILVKLIRGGVTHLPLDLLAASLACTSWNLVARDISRDFAFLLNLFRRPADLEDVTRLVALLTESRSLGLKLVANESVTLHLKTLFISLEENDSDSESSSLEEVFFEQYSEAMGSAVISLFALGFAAPRLLRIMCEDVPNSSDTNHSMSLFFSRIRPHCAYVEILHLKENFGQRSTYHVTPLIAPLITSLSPKLTTLKLDSIDLGNDLKTVLSHCSCIKNLDAIEIDPEEIVALLPSWPSLTSFNFAMNTGSSHSLDPLLIELGLTVPGLQHLTLRFLSDPISWSPSDPSSAALAFCVAHCTELQSLNITNAAWLADLFLRVLARHGRRLHTLRLQSCTNIVGGDSVFRRGGAGSPQEVRWPELEELVLTGSPVRSGFVEKVVKACPKLFIVRMLGHACTEKLEEFGFRLDERGETWIRG